MLLLYQGRLPINQRLAMKFMLYCRINDTNIGFKSTNFCVFLLNFVVVVEYGFSAIQYPVFLLLIRDKKIKIYSWRGKSIKCVFKEYIGEEKDLQLQGDHENMFDGSFLNSFDPVWLHSQW